jgi:hypothetical protein
MLAPCNSSIKDLEIRLLKGKLNSEHKFTGRGAEGLLLGGGGINKFQRAWASKIPFILKEST